MKFGTITDTGAATWLLPRLVGWGVAAEVLYSGSLYGAADALAMRLVNHVVPDDELHGFTAQLAATMAANSPCALRTTKELLFQGLQESALANVLQQSIKGNDGDPSPAGSFGPGQGQGQCVGSGLVQHLSLGGGQADAAAGDEGLQAGDPEAVQPAGSASSRTRIGPTRVPSRSSKQPSSPGKTRSSVPSN